MRLAVAAARLGRSWPVLIALVLAAGTFWLLRTVDLPGTTRTLAAPHVPDYYMEGVESVVMGLDGEPRRRLRADYVAHFADTDTHELEAPYLELVREEGPPWHVRSERGWVSATGDVLLLLGKVHIWRNADTGELALEVFTEDLRVLPDTEYGETDRPVLIRTPDSETRGIGMRAHLSESRIELLSEVRTRYVPPNPASDGPPDAPGAAGATGPDATPGAAHEAR